MIKVKFRSQCSFLYSFDLRIYHNCGSDDTEDYKLKKTLKPTKKINKLHQNVKKFLGCILHNKIKSFGYFYITWSVQNNLIFYHKNIYHQQEYSIHINAAFWWKKSESEIHCHQRRIGKSNVHILYHYASQNTSVKQSK